MASVTSFHGLYRARFRQTASWALLPLLPPIDFTTSASTSASAATPIGGTDRSERRRATRKWNQPWRLFGRSSCVGSRGTRLFSTDTVDGPSKRQLLTYITDVEGDRAYLERYVRQSKVLKFISCEPRWKINDLRAQHRNHDSFYFPYDHAIDFASDDAILVYGGDVWDKGGHDLYVIRQLMDLKRRYQDRVIFVLGNRDTNKLRILQELGISPGLVPHHPGLRWLRGTGRVGDPEGDKPVPLEPTERLKWILANSMGSPNAFALRRSELRWEQNLRREKGMEYHADITDDDVVQSYRESCHPKGELGLFMSQANLCARVGDVFFVHGALPLTEEILDREKKLIEEGNGRSIWDDLTFALPWIEKHDNPVEDINEWIHMLNEFCATCVEEWTHHIAQIESGDHVGGPSEIWVFKGGYDYGPSYSALLQYGMGSTPKGKNPTVVYNTWCPDGMPSRFFPDDGPEGMSLYARLTSEFLQRANLRLIATGHKPQGDIPTPIRVSTDRPDGRSNWILACDTSYSGDTFWHGGDGTSNGGSARENLGRGTSLSFRGDVAVSEVLMELQDDKLQSVHSHGVLSDGTNYESKNLLSLEDPILEQQRIRIGELAPEPAVPVKDASPTRGPWWAKTVFSDNSVLYHTADGFDVYNFLAESDSKSKQS